MTASYAVRWWTDTCPQATGRLELGANALFLVGTVDGESVHDEIPYGDLTSVAVGRSAADRVDGRPTLVLRRAGRGLLRIAGIAQPWIVSELVERLTALQTSRA